ncbi:60S ribosomal protein L31 [Candidatus Woesearchaeota archaeon]|nr:60S ribosomal protein L31 [Candidatus Woesearchaeota archaeon]
MAKNKVERVYTIPLRQGFIKVPKYYRAKRAVSQIRKFVEKHMKSEDVRIGSVLNEFVWSKGITNPPGKVTVKTVQHDDFVSVELEGYDYKVQKVQTEKTDKPTSFKDKLAAKLKQPSDGSVEEVEEPKEAKKAKSEEVSSVEEAVSEKPVSKTVKKSVKKAVKKSD